MRPHHQFSLAVSPALSLSHQHFLLYVYSKYSGYRVTRSIRRTSFFSFFFFFGMINSFIIVRTSRILYYLYALISYSTYTVDFQRTHSRNDHISRTQRKVALSYFTHTMTTTKVLKNEPVSLFTCTYTDTLIYRTCFHLLVKFVNYIILSTARQRIIFYLSHRCLRNGAMKKHCIHKYHILTHFLYNYMQDNILIMYKWSVKVA